MGGDIEFSGLQVVSEILGVEDIETLIINLMAIREFKRRG